MILFAIILGGFLLFGGLALLAVGQTLLDVLMEEHPILGALVTCILFCGMIALICWLLMM